AHALWKLHRSLERVGWNVETQLNRILFGMGQVVDAPYLGVDVGNVVVPLIIFPSADALASPTGLLAQYNRAGAAALGVICDQGALDQMVTAARRWGLSQAEAPSMSVLVLEAPRYNPTLLSPKDSAVRSISVNHRTIDALDWDL